MFSKEKIVLKAYTSYKVKNDIFINMLKLING